MDRFQWASGRFHLECNRINAGGFGRERWHMLAGRMLVAPFPTGSAAISAPSCFVSCVQTISEAKARSHVSIQVPNYARSYAPTMHFRQECGRQRCSWQHSAKLARRPCHPVNQAVRYPVGPSLRQWGKKRRGVVSGAYPGNFGLLPLNRAMVASIGVGTRASGRRRECRGIERARGRLLPHCPTDGDEHGGCAAARLGVL